MKQNNKKTLNLIAISVILLFTVFHIIALAASPATTKIQNTVNETTVVDEPETITLNNEPLLFPELVYVASYDINTYTKLLDNLQTSLNQLKAAVVSEEYTAEAYEAMHDEINRLEIINTKVSSNVARMTIWESEYYYATKAWNFLIEQGYNEAVVSGIIGNMMIETAGGTLYLKPFDYNPSGDYYGLCQWSLYYHPTIADMSFDQQLEYLMATIEKEFNTFGNCYISGFTYEDFLEMTNPEDAARAFAAVYERCGSDSYNQRAEAAARAYRYFSFA
jgi:hypothetical protein